MERLWLLWIELIVVFAALPLLLYYRLLPNLPIPILLLMAIGAWIVLRHDPSFDRLRLFNMGAVAPHTARVLLGTAALCALLGLGVWRFAPELLFSLIKRSPAF